MLDANPPPPMPPDAPTLAHPSMMASPPSPTMAMAPWWQRFPIVPFLLTACFAAFILFPPVRENNRLIWTFAGLSGAFLVWQVILLAVAKRRSQLFKIEYVPIRSHYVQALVQFSIMAYWGWFAREVYAQAPLILSQVFFLYIFEAMVTWSRGRTWRLGFGPMPIILSTNLLLWFKDDYFLFQFLMIATGALGKQFVTWERDGRRTHIFNPSAFGQFLFAVVLIITGTTNDYTWGERIAETFEAPQMLLIIFVGGLIVQYLFHVTLMTVAACAALVLMNLIYTQITGVYYFVNINISAPIFLGLHLLVTDPATSPRTNTGRVIFGALYGAAYFALFRVLDNANIPLFWDKLLPVPFLNLMVPFINRVTARGWVGGLNRRWEKGLRPSRLNLVHMACWIGLFATLFSTGYIEGPHPGNSIPFWKRAVAEGKHHAGPSLIMATGAQAEGGNSGEAYNELGLMCMDGTLPGVEQRPDRAAHYFAMASERGCVEGSVNVAIQYLFLGGRLQSEADHVGRALDRLEGDPRYTYLVAYAYETGRGRPQDYRKAIELYERAGANNLFACKGLARIGLTTNGQFYDLRRVAPILNKSALTDEESCWYLGYMLATGNGLPRDLNKAMVCFQKSCELGSAKACELVKLPQIPPFSRPVLLVPGWLSAYPVTPSTLDGAKGTPVAIDSSPRR